jgi:hypothetical protein
MRFYIYGASFADNVYGLIDSYDKSPLHKLTTKDGIKVIETILKTNDIIPSCVTMRTRTQKGGKYRVVLLIFHIIMPSHVISFIGENSSKTYMTTGKANNGRSKDDITDDKRRGGRNGGKNSANYMNTGFTSKGRSKDDVTAEKSAGGAASLGVARTKSDGSKPDWMVLELIRHPSTETFTTRASQTKASLIAALHHRNAFGPLQRRAKMKRFNKHYDDAKAKNNSCTFVCEQGGEWKLTLSEDRPIGVSTVFTKEELDATSQERDKQNEDQQAERKRKRD